ncbi:MAG: nicotinate-nucleotide--dimethylbenzimidazole phosphoribosyltransferase [Actinomycetia bacterium]|nr:nicotinate-nucleotide--dimethylbenzimidazole phosphoribosyltransferase [Actinomycetes bacterium]
MHAESDVAEVVSQVEPVDEAWRSRAWERLDSLSKPPRSLGVLEELAARIAAVQRTERPVAHPASIVVMAGDHGVAAQNVTPYPQEVTVQMLTNFAAGGAAINQLASHAGASLRIVDVGVAADTRGIPGVEQRKVRAGTFDISQGPAMSREEAAMAVMAGVEVAFQMVDSKTRILGTGEMGIGNTTAAAALASTFIGVPPADVVGRGTGLDDRGLAHKVEVVSQALAVNHVDPEDPLGALAAVGGLEIAGMAGLVLGAAARKTCVVADGFISGVAALAAVRMAPHAAGYLFPSHLSAERGHRVVLEGLGLRPVLELDMRLGEGTGAAMAISILDAACRVMTGMATFQEAGVSAGDQK